MKISVQLLGVFVPALLIVVGGACVVYEYVQFESGRHASVQIDKQKVGKLARVSSKRQAITQVVIPVAGISLDVKKGVYNYKTKQWSLDKKHAFYISESATPIVYGHAIADVFGRLQDLRGGETLIATLIDGHTKSLTYQGAEYIHPEDTTILSEAYPRSIILMSCSGPMSEYRQLFYFEEKADS